MSGFPEKGADLRGSPGKPPGKFGELPGKSGKLPGNPWIAVKFHSERTSGEVAEKLPGKFGELPGKSGDLPEARGWPDSLSATRQICLQLNKTKVFSTLSFPCFFLEFLVFSLVRISLLF